MAAPMLTTTDNPYDPFTQFVELYTYDMVKGYATCSYVARITKTSEELSEADNELAIEQAIDEILEFNLLGIYKKVYKDSED